MSTIIGGSSPSITFSDSTTQASAGLPLTGGTLSGALTVPTLNTPSGVLATQNGMTGIAKAWVNFDGTTASPSTIRGSFNVTSITKNGTGDYTVNFTTSMSNANYATVIQVRYGSANAAYLSANIYSDATYTTSSVRFLTGQINTSYDCPVVNVIVCGA